MSSSASLLCAHSVCVCVREIRKFTCSPGEPRVIFHLKIFVSPTCLCPMRSLAQVWAWGMAAFWGPCFHLLTCPRGGVAPGVSRRAQEEAWPVMGNPAKAGLGSGCHPHGPPPRAEEGRARSGSKWKLSASGSPSALPARAPLFHSPPHPSASLSQS